VKISIPNLSLIVLIGPSGSGKSTFAQRHFLAMEVLSSDTCRAMVSDAENDQSVTNDAFAVLHFIAAKRLALGRLMVIDATNVQIRDDILDAADVIGKRIIATRLRGNVTVREANATAALEVMSRFAANPKWLIYLPPTMSPSETSNQPGLLEHPAEAFAYFRSQGAPQVICEEKHMGSRAVVIVCRDENAAKERFGIAENEIGIVYTRTGRRFFNEPELERQVLVRVQTALTKADFWAAHLTKWVCLDCELMPWSAKAQELLRAQYAAVGAAGRAALPRAVQALQQTAERMNGDERSRLEEITNDYRQHEANLAGFVAAYREYCWSVSSVSDFKLAPFHLLATEGRVHAAKNHLWHMESLAAICQHYPENFTGLSM
jgi:protein phosphatase